MGGFDWKKGCAGAWLGSALHHDINKRPIEEGAGAGKKGGCIGIIFMKRSVLSGGYHSGAQTAIQHVSKSCKVFFFERNCPVWGLAHRSLDGNPACTNSCGVSGHEWNRWFVSCVALHMQYKIIISM